VTRGKLSPQEDVDAAAVVNDQILAVFMALPAISFTPVVNVAV
jgi:hypothetical protein